jgi:hypothetical protein
MNEDRKRILAPLAEGKINPDEAERLIAALERSGTSSAGQGPASPARRLKYLRVEVDANRPESGPTRVNVRAPMNLPRAGVRLSALIPPGAREEVNAAMARQGMVFDINQLRPENLEEMIEQLADLTLDVDNERAKVRIYCE